ncbi:MAG TPA: maleylpyruvate isomerase N-terminal domain-containing protein [Euzebyales bacterium]|nr:maleylpyruvate isomerase N-terminal domain-containing protein [Euzebyales bacterium]
MAEMDAFAREAGRIERTLGEIDPADWARPGLGEWDLGELVFHLTRQADRLAEYRGRPLSGDRAAVDRFTYYNGAAAMAADIAERAREGAAQVDPISLPGAFATAWRRSAAAATAPDALIETAMGPMRTDDYAATRVVELVVHHMDVRRALDLPPHADAMAARVVAAVLEGMLDGDRPRNLGRTRFILVATGRTPHDDPRFPVFR